MKIIPAIIFALWKRVLRMREPAAKSSGPCPLCDPEGGHQKNVYLLPALWISDELTTDTVLSSWKSLLFSSLSVRWATASPLWFPCRFLKALHQDRAGWSHGERAELSLLAALVTRTPAPWILGKHQHLYESHSGEKVALNPALGQALEATECNRVHCTAVSCSGGTQPL